MLTFQEYKKSSELEWATRSLIKKVKYLYPEVGEFMASPLYKQLLAEHMGKTLIVNGTKFTFISLAGS